MVYPKILRKQPTACFHSSPSSPTISSAVSPGVISTVLDESVLLVLRHVFCFFLARCGNTPLQKKKTRTLYIYTLYLQLYKNSPSNQLWHPSIPKTFWCRKCNGNKQQNCQKRRCFSKQKLSTVDRRNPFPKSITKIFLIFH